MGLPFVVYYNFMKVTNDCESPILNNEMIQHNCLQNPDRKETIAVKTLTNAEKKSSKEKWWLICWINDEIESSKAKMVVNRMD